ncbi:MAG: (4Fe-4S)-binding protein [Bacteroides sp.]|nr:(4Fe-4S)-binding protein [Bacteroides sp.]
MEPIHKEYSNGEITIVWQPALCTHACVCLRMLPNVYRPKERPWIRIENATTEELIHQVHNCPSGALRIKSEMEAGPLPNGKSIL